MRCILFSENDITREIIRLISSKQGETMKPYRGIIRIVCLKKTGCLRSLRKDVEPGCLDCPQAETIIENLAAKPLFIYHSPEIKTGLRVKKEDLKNGI